MFLENLMIRNEITMSGIFSSKIIIRIRLKITLFKPDAKTVKDPVILGASVVTISTYGV